MAFLRPFLRPFAGSLNAFGTKALPWQRGYDSGTIIQPNTIWGSSLLCWLRADTADMTVVGGGIDTWEDKTANNLDARQTTDANRPDKVTVSDGVVGDFETTNGDYMIFTGHAATFDQTAALSFGFRGKLEAYSGGSTHAMYSSWNATSASRKCYMRLEENGGGGAERVSLSVQNSTTNRTGTYTTGSLAAAWHTHFFVFDGAGATDADKLKYYLNGTQQTLTYSGAIAATVNSNAQDPQFCAQNVASRWDGTVDELVYINGVATAAQILLWHNYRSRA